MNISLLRVLSMNIWTFSAPYEKRMKLLRAGVERLSPDLMAFQEAGYADGRHQVAELLDGLNYHIIHQFEYGVSLGRDNGCCIASRWPMKEVSVVPLNVTENAQRYPYCLLIARVSAPTPVDEILFVCAKPSWEWNREYERELQAVILAETVLSRTNPSDFPPIIAGDFDATPEHASIRFLSGKQSLAGKSVHFRDAWAEAGDGTGGYTWSWQNGYTANRLHQRHHCRRIDYIFLGSPHNFEQYAAFTTCRVEMTEPVCGVWPSDHYAVYAEIETVP